MARGSGKGRGPNPNPEMGDQPVVTPRGLPYGEAGALENLQRNAPLAQPSTPVPARQAAPAGPVADPTSPLLAPPTQPMAAPTAPIFVTDQPDDMLRALYAVYPHPDILRLIQD